MSFDDAMLDPRRTTRAGYRDPADAHDSIMAGDLLLVDTSAYGVDGEHWCELAYASPGTASVYPFKARVPGRGIGQYRASEILRWQRPLRTHEIYAETRLYIERDQAMAAVEAAMAGAQERIDKIAKR